MNNKHSDVSWHCFPLAAINGSSRIRKNKTYFLAVSAYNPSIPQQTYSRIFTTTISSSFLLSGIFPSGVLVGVENQEWRKGERRQRDRTWQWPPCPHPAPTFRVKGCSDHLLQTSRTHSRELCILHINVKL